MSQCYAHQLGDCEGAIEDEHFFSDALQQMLGTVDVAGLAWLRGGSKKMVPGSYAHSFVLCAKHHDDLDGLDSAALQYFRNLMLISAGGHIGKGTAGSIDDIVPVIDGRSLEKWFLKAICGAVAARSFENASVIPQRWVDALFSRIAWPEEWALYVLQGTRTVQKRDVSFHIDFHWSSTGELNGVIANAFSVENLFSLVPPDSLSPLTLRRPRFLGAAISRPGGLEVLSGAPPGTHVRFTIRWPEPLPSRATSTKPLWNS